MRADGCVVQGRVWDLRDANLCASGGTGEEAVHFLTLCRTTLRGAKQVGSRRHRPPLLRGDIFLVHNIDGACQRGDQRIRRRRVPIAAPLRRGGVICAGKQDKGDVQTSRLLQKEKTEFDRLARPCPSHPGSVTFSCAPVARPNKLRGIAVEVRTLPLHPTGRNDDTTGPRGHHQADQLELNHRLRSTRSGLLWLRSGWLRWWDGWLGYSRSAAARTSTSPERVRRICFVICMCVFTCALSGASYIVQPHDKWAVCDASHRGLTVPGGRPTIPWQTGGPA